MAACDIMIKYQSSNYQFYYSVLHLNFFAFLHHWRSCTLFFSLSEKCQNIFNLCSLSQATVTLQVSYIPPPGMVPTFQPPPHPEAQHTPVELDTVTGQNTHVLLEDAKVSLPRFYFTNICLLRAASL